MCRFASARHAFLSSLVVAAISSSSVGPAQGLTEQERQTLESQIKAKEAEIQSLNQSIAASDEWIKKHPWVIAGCPFVKAGVTFVIPASGKQWTIVAWNAEVDKSSKSQAEKDRLKARALQMSEQEAKLCQDPYYTSYQPSKDKVDALKKEIAKIKTALAAPPPGPAAKWNGEWTTRDDKTVRFTVTVAGNTFTSSGEYPSSIAKKIKNPSPQEQLVFSKDEGCVWKNPELVECSKTRHQIRTRAYFWEADGTSQFKMNKRGTVDYTFWASGDIQLKEFKGDADLRKFLQDAINGEHKQQEIQLVPRR